MLFPRPTSNLDGQEPVSGSTYRLALYRWLARCDVRDEHGQPVSLTPHQWRHTLGTVLINRDVPQHVVRQILDHESPLDDGHLRAAVRQDRPPALGEAARKVNATGRSPSAPTRRAARRRRLGQAAARPGDPGAAERLLRASPGQDLPACKRLPDLPDVRHHGGVPARSTMPRRQPRLQIISAAEARGQTRVAEMNRQVAGNLDKIITALEDEEETEPGGGRRCALTTRSDHAAARHGTS